MIYFNFRTTITQKYYYALTWSCVTGLPAVIFGVVSLMKKTDKITAAAGIAAGAASVMTAGTQPIVREDFDRLLDMVKIQEV